MTQSAFEHWYRANYMQDEDELSPAMSNDFRYRYTRTQDMWAVWQAAAQFTIDNKERES